MSQGESKLSGKIIAALNRRRDCFAWKNHGSEYTISGLPDICVIASGLFIGLETKMPGKRGDTSVVQEHVMGLMRGAGAHAQVVCSVEEALEVVMVVVARSSD